MIDNTQDNSQGKFYGEKVNADIGTRNINSDIQNSHNFEETQIE
jgi:hypothetical protein